MGQIAVHIVLHSGGVIAGQAGEGGQAQGLLAPAQGGLVQGLPAGHGVVPVEQIGTVGLDGGVIGGAQRGGGGQGVVIVALLARHVEVEHGLDLGVNHVDIGVEVVQLFGGVGGHIHAGAVVDVGEAALTDHNGLVVGAGQLHDGLDGGDGVVVIDAHAVEGVLKGASIAHLIGRVPAGEVLKVGGVIGGHAHPVHVLIAGVVLVDGIFQVGDVVGRKYHLDVAVGPGGGGHLLECLLEDLGVAVVPVVHLGAYAQQHGGAAHLGADGLKGLLNIAVVVQKGTDAIGALVGDVPGQLNHAAVEDLLKALAVVFPIIQPVGQGVAVPGIDVRQGVIAVGLGAPSGGAEPAAGTGAHLIGGGGVVGLGIDRHILGRLKIIQAGPVHPHQVVAVIVDAAFGQELGVVILDIRPFDRAVQVALDLAGPGGVEGRVLHDVGHLDTHAAGGEDVIGPLRDRDELVRVVGALDVEPLLLERPVGLGKCEGRSRHTHACHQYPRKSC